MVKNYHLEWGHGETTNQILKGEDHREEHGEEHGEECGQVRRQVHREEHRGPLLTVLGYLWLPLATIDLVCDNREFKD